MSDDTCNVGAPDRDRIHVNEADARSTAPRPSVLAQRRCA